MFKARITSANGLVEHLAYSNLNLNGSYAGNRVSAQPLSVAVFDGSVVANVNAVLASRPPFDASISFRHINVRSAACELTFPGRRAVLRTGHDRRALRRGVQP